VASTINAVFEHGVFRPESQCDIPDGARVVLAIGFPDGVEPPTVASGEERQRILRGIVERMKRNPWPADAPHFTRDEMYDCG